MPEIRQELRGYCKGVAERNICFFVFNYTRVEKSIEYYKNVYKRRVRVSNMLSIQDIDKYGNAYIFSDCFKEYYKDKYGFVTITHETD